MMTDKGPQVLEFNARLGDPETQAIMHRMDSDFAPVLRAAADGYLADASSNGNRRRVCAWFSPRRAIRAKCAPET